jgi:diguanylate cyclase (GGDEF)-like protein/PAS domain S-box-containing protein
VEPNQSAALARSGPGGLEERAQLAAIVATSSDAILGCAPDGTVLTWNAAAERMFGWHAHEILGQNVSLLVPPERIHETEHHRWLLEHGQTVPPFETVRLARDRTPILVQASLSGIYDDTGTFAGVAYILRDITEHKRLEQAAREAQRRLETLLDNLPGMAYRCRNDPQWTAEFLSRGCETLTGYAPEDFVVHRKLAYADIIAPEDRVRVWEAVQEALARRTSFQLEYRIRTASGAIKWVWEQGSGIYDSEGRLLALEGLVLDVTERKQAQQESERRATLSRLVEALARAASAVENPVQAMQSCLERLCEHGSWTLGSVGILPSGCSGLPQAVLWRCADPLRYARFIHLSERTEYAAGSDEFVGRMLASKKPVWIEDLAQAQSPGRLAEARRCGLRSAFVFPILIGGEAVAFIEFFADAPRAPDRQLLEAGESIGSQLARLLERQRALDYARAAEHKLAAILGALHEVVWSLDVRSGRLLYLNEAAKRLARRSLAELFSDRRLWRRMVHRADRPALRRAVRALLQHGTLDHEFRLVLADGEVRTVQCRARLVRAPDGMSLRADGTLFDATERKQAEELRARLAAVVESAEDAILTRALDGTILTWNPAAERMFGWRAEEAVGRHIHLIVPPERRGENRSYREQVHQGRSVPSYDTVRLARNGQRIAVSLSQYPIRDERGEVIAVTLVLRDIAERVRSERCRALEHAVARVLAESVALAEAMPRLIRTMCEIMDWSYGARWTWDEREGSVRRAEYWAQFALDFEAADRDYWLRLAPGPAAGLMRRAWQRGEATWIADIAREPDFRRKPSCLRFGLRSAFAFPIVAGGETIGMMEFFGREVQQPDELLLQIAASIGRQIGQFVRRKQAEEALRSSEERFRAIFEQAGVGMALCSLAPDAPRWLRVNPRLCEMLGCSREELAQRSVLDFVLPEERPVLQQWSERLARGEITSYIREERYRRSDGALLWTHTTVCTVRDEHAQPAYTVAVLQDITERKRAEERAEYLSHYDVVTGLPNRRLFNDRLALALARARRLGKITALLLLDLDRFKQVNETLGQNRGDELLRAVTARLRERLREVDTIARLGGDEFAVILEEVGGPAEALQVADKILQAVAEPLLLEGEEVFITTSIGTAVADPAAGDDTAEQLVARAELAMYQAKHEGRNTAQLYASAPVPRPPLGLEARLRRALERGELLLHYQPRVHIATGAITGAEALLRWQSPQLGLVSPADFIPVAEETGLIVPIGEWVLESACLQARRLGEAGYPLAISVNLSPRQFRQKTLCESVERALACSGLEPQALELEITESMIMHQPDRVIAMLHRLRALGVRLSVDDFGTGYSSLSYLKRFPVDTLKIDQSFVRELPASPDDGAIVRAIVALAASLGLRTVAEGVENDQQLGFLARLHCDECQGYFFSKPLPPGELLELLQARPLVQPPCWLPAPGGRRAAPGEGASLHRRR